MIHLSDRRRVELALPASMMARIVAHLAAQPETDRQLIAEIGRDCDLAQMAPMAGLQQDRQRVLMNRLRRARVAALDWMADRSIAVAYVAVLRWIKAMIEAGILVPAEDAPFLAAADRLLAEVQTRPENVDLLGHVDRSGTKAARRIHDILRGQGYFREYPSPFAASADARANWGEHVELA